MKDAKQLYHELSTFKDSFLDENEQEIIKLRQAQRDCSEASRILSSKLDDLVEALNGMGLAVRTFTFQPGALSNSVSLTAEAISNKFRFIKFNGYDGYGRGKNGNRLKEKARKIADTLKSAIDVKNLSVNPFSLEVRDDEVGSVMIDFRF